MSADGFADYDAWKCDEPPPEYPDPPGPHDDCDRVIESLEAEIAQLHRRIDELEIELAACREGHRS